jgi:hypothetical protein
VDERLLLQGIQAVVVASNEVKHMQICVSDFILDSVNALDQMSDVGSAKKSVKLQILPFSSSTWRF